jgi:hypothetical protein
MPADLRAAHAALDRAVDRLYRPEPFAGDRDRVEHLFTRYAALVDPLATIGARAMHARCKLRQSWTGIRAASDRRIASRQNAPNRLYWQLIGRG